MLGRDPGAEQEKEAEVSAGRGPGGEEEREAERGGTATQMSTELVLVKRVKKISLHIKRVYKEYIKKLTNSIWNKSNKTEGHDSADYPTFLMYIYQLHI